MSLGWVPLLPSPPLAERGLIALRGVWFAPARTPGGPSENSAARRDEQLPRKPDGLRMLNACRGPSLFCLEEFAALKYAR